jgi:GT2 family glycosyltransferase
MGTEEVWASVVVCVYNRPDQVLRCLDSLLAMNGPSTEVVVVDDCSTDDTPAQLEQFRSAHPEAVIRIVRTERHLGVSGARNAGIDAARGEFVAFTDSDCTVGRGWLPALLAPFSDPAVAAAAGAVENTPLRNLAERAAAGLYRMHEWSPTANALVGCNMAFRRSALARYRFDPSFDYNCDESDVSYRLLADGFGVVFAAGAAVRHDHPLTVRKYLHMAYRQGRGAARLWYKRGTYLGPELWPAAAALLTLPLGLLSPWLLAVPAACVALQLAFIFGVERYLKGLPLGEAVRVFPLDVLYYACRIWAVFGTLLQIGLGGEPALRRSKQAWRAGRKARAAAPPGVAGPG